MSEWSDGFASGWAAAGRAFASGEAPASYDIMEKARRKRTRKPSKSKPKRKASAYSKRYGAAFKRLAPKYKKKGGGWKKNGFKRCAAAARRVAKR